MNQKCVRDSLVKRGQPTVVALRQGGKVGVGRIMDATEGVEDAGVAEVDFWSLDEAFAQVGLPWEQAADHVGLLQGIQIRAGGVGSNAQRGGDCGCRSKAGHDNAPPWFKTGPSMRAKDQTPRPPDHAQERSE